MAGLEDVPEGEFNMFLNRSGCGEGGSKVCARLVEADKENFSLRAN